MRALLLDFDGLICDTERAAFRSWTELYLEYGLAFPLDLWTQMTGRADGECLALHDLSRRLGRPVGAIVRAARRRRKQTLCQQEPLRPGVHKVLARATVANVRLAVVSSSPRSWVRHHLVRLRVLDRFFAVVTGDEAVRHKPAPDLYRLALHRIGAAAEEVLALEDSPTGVQAACAAGIRCIAVPSAVGVAASHAGAVDVIASLDCLLSHPEWHRIDA